MSGSNSPPPGGRPGGVLDRSRLAGPLRDGALLEGRLAPLLACGALVAILGVQLILPAAAPPPDLPGLAARRARPILVPLSPEYAAILTAPIFAPDRHPGGSGGVSDTGGGTLAGYAALGAAVGGPVATGVVVIPGGGVKTLRRGEQVEGWRLVSVDRTHLTFERNGSRHSLVVGAPAESTLQGANGPKPATADTGADQ